MSDFALHAKHFVLSGHVAGEGWLPVRQGRFGAWSKTRPEDLPSVEAAGAWVAPGLVDTHIHGFFGHATTDNDPDGLIEASRELARRGTTSWLPTCFTDSTERIGKACCAIARAATDCRGGAAHIQGVYLEGPFFSERHKGAQNPAYLTDPSYESFSFWQEQAEGMIVKSALAPERAGSEEYISRVSAEGVVACIGHTDATFEEALRGVDAGATCFVHTYNGMRGLHHREPGVVGCAMATPSTYAELICDGHHVVPGAARALIAAKGWDHVALITDCLGCGGLPEGSYMSGGLPVVLRDGVCWLADMSALAGSVLTLAEAVRNVFAWQLVTAEQAIRMATEVPARSAHLDNRCGLILPGRVADLTVFDEGLHLKETYVAGVRVR